MPDSNQRKLRRCGDTETAEPVEETEEKQAENEAGAEEEKASTETEKSGRFSGNKEAAFYAFANNCRRNFSVGL